VCDTDCKSSRRLTYYYDYYKHGQSYDSYDDSSCKGKRRLTIKDASGDSYESKGGGLTGNGCGVWRRRLTYGYDWSSKESGGDSKDSGGDSSVDYCDCGPGYVAASSDSKSSSSKDSGDHSRRGLTWYYPTSAGADSKGSNDSNDGCYCGHGRRVTWASYDSTSGDDCDCSCECECECMPEPIPEPELSCCADDIVDECDVVGSAPCTIGTRVHDLS